MVPSLFFGGFMADPKVFTVNVTEADRQLVQSSIEIHKAVIKRRINGEVNQSIKEILQRQLRELEALQGRV